MLLRVSTATRCALLTATAALVLAAINVWWFATYRHGYPFDIDEAGYTSFGLVDYWTLHYGGLHSWWNSIQQQGTFAPLVPAVTSLLLTIKLGLMDGFLTLTMFFLVLTAAVYCIGERLAGPRLAALAAVTIAMIPGTFSFEREYIYALPTAALLACAVFALLRSEGLAKRLPAVLCGAALGLMLLARTMAISYVPGVLVAGLIALIARNQNDLNRRLLNLALLVLTSVAVAATWYARNLQSVIDYLTSYGYGKESSYYGRHNSLISLGRFRGVGERMVSEDLFLPLSLAVLVGLTALLILVVKRFRHLGATEAAHRLLRSDALSVATVFVLGYLALMTSRNGGNGFTYPLTIFLPLLAVLPLRRLPRAVVPALVVVALISALNLISMATIWAPASHTRMVSLPGFTESFPITKGVPKAVFLIREQVPGPETIFDSHDAEWLRADTEVADAFYSIHGPNGEAPFIAFASRSRILNTNTVNLASLVKYHQSYLLVQLLAEPTDSVTSYIHQLIDPKNGPPSVLVTMSRNAGDFEPLVTQRYAETAARRLGFRRIDALRLPDGRQLRIWQKAEAAETS